MNDYNELKRYSKIFSTISREAILIQGRGCAWKKCIFCDYYNDVSDDPYAVNVPVIQQITGEFGALDVSNSGSAMEIDRRTLNFLIDKVNEKNIDTVWFEARWNYRYALKDFKALFPKSTVKFRMGVETFNPILRDRWNKGVPPDVSAQNISRFYDGVSLMVGLEGQTIQDIRSDIEIADRFFEYFSLNVFTENTTKQKPNAPLIREFINRFLGSLNKNPKAEVLLQNTDWGIG